MNKKCARPECGKTVYPLEELKCLDKVWHKPCFKCSVCGMTLSMKNYKGYNKMPYCEAHYPTTVATAVADTPEMRRLKENTKNQSLAKYHEDFEKMKGSKIQIADDPEIARIKKNTTVQSQALYHGDMEKKELMEKIRPPLEESSSKAPVPGPMIQAGHHQNNSGASPYSTKIQTGSTLIYSSEQGGKVAPSNRGVGSIADYDPLNGQWGSAAVSRPPMQSTDHYINSQQSPGVQSGQAQQFRLPQQTRSPQSPPQQTPPSGPHRRGGGGLVVRAMYDYGAADSDEVTFMEGDVIVGCQVVDEGWMTGTVQRTGQWGMLPANYVERVH